MITDNARVLNIPLNDSKLSLWLAKAADSDIMSAIEFGYPTVVKLNETLANQLALRNESNTSAVIGAVGEDFVESILKKRFIHVDNVANCAKSGDLSLYLRNRKIVIEVKNYSYPVPTSGVSKFQRDLLTTNAAGGVFISLNTPISCFAEEFVIRYEVGPGGVTVPCAYIVTSDENSIIIACQMVSNIIQFFEYAAVNLHDRDKIKENIHNITKNLSDISLARDKFQCQFSKISSDLLDIMLQFASAEGRIRAQTDAMLSELYHMDTHDMSGIMAELQKNSYYLKYKQENKDNIHKVISQIHGGGSCNMNDHAWKISAKRFVNNRTEIGINFSLTRVDITVPRGRLSIEALTDAISSLGKKITFDSNKLCIELDCSTIEYISNKIIPHDNN